MKTLLFSLLLLLSAYSHAQNSDWKGKYMQIDELYHENFIRVQDENGKWGFADATGKELVPCKYDNAGYFHDGLAAVQQDKKTGWINSLGQEVISCQFDKVVVDYFNDGKIFVGQNGRYGFINTQGQGVLEYTDYKIIAGYLIAAQKDKKWALFFHTGVMISQGFVYDEIDDYCSGEITAARIGANWGFINTEGEETTPFEYSKRDCHEAVYTVCKAGKWGAVSYEGEEIVSCIYSSVEYLGHNLLKIKAEGLYGLVNLEGETVLKPAYTKIEGQYAHSLFIVAKQNGKWGLFYPDGQTISKGCLYDEIAISHSDELFAVRVAADWGFINTEGEKISNSKYDKVIYNRDKKLWAVSRANKWGLLSGSGKEIAACSYDAIQCLSHNNTAAQSAKSYWLVDANGKVILEIKYPTNELLNLKGYFVAAKKGAKWGLLRPNGEVINGGFIYDEVAEEHGGTVFAVREAAHWGFVNTKGKKVSKIEYSALRYYSNEDLWAVCKAGKWGLADGNGQETASCLHDSVKHIGYGVFEFEQAGLYGLMDLNGKIILQPKYNTITVQQWDRFDVTQNGKRFIIDDKERCVYLCE